MKSFYITTDSGCDLSMEVCAQKDILPICMDYIIDGTIFTDTMADEDTRHFYNMMREGAAPATTQINTAAFLEFWKPLLSDGIPIVHISLGSGISGTCNNANSAARSLEDSIPGAKIYVIDSTIASLGYGMLALAAARLRDSGLDAEQCAAWLNARTHSVNTYYTTADLKYLQRGGRVSRAKAVFGTMLNINPILDLSYDGHLRVCDKARGNDATLKRVLDHIADTVISPKDQTIYIAHSDTPEKAQLYADAIMSRFGFKDAYFSYIGSIIGSHAGPGLVACFYFGKDRSAAE